MPPRRSSVPWPDFSQQLCGAPVFHPSHDPVQVHVRPASANPYASAARLVNAL